MYSVRVVCKCVDIGGKRGSRGNLEVTHQATAISPEAPAALPLSPPAGAGALMQHPRHCAVRAQAGLQQRGTRLGVGVPDSDGLLDDMARRNSVHSVWGLEHSMWARFLEGVRNAAAHYSGTAGSHSWLRTDTALPACIFPRARPSRGHCLLVTARSAHHTTPHHTTPHHTTPHHTTPHHTTPHHTTPHHTTPHHTTPHHTTPHHTTPHHTTPHRTALPHCPGAVGSGSPAVHCHTALGQWAVELLRYTAALPWGSGQWKSCRTALGPEQSNSRGTLLQCLGAVGRGTPAAHRRTAWGQCTVGRLLHSALPLGAVASGQWNTCCTLPHCLGAVGSGTRAVHCHTALGQWSVELLRHIAALSTQSRCSG